MEEELKRIEDHTKKVEAAEQIGEAISRTVGKSTTVDHKEFTEAIEKVSLRFLIINKKARDPCHLMDTEMSSIGSGIGNHFPMENHR